jgi:hypothetical protein
MKKTLFTVAIAVVILAACTGKKAKEEAAKAAEAAQIQQIDSATVVMMDTKNQVDFAAKKVDRLINEL